MSFLNRLLNRKTETRSADPYTAFMRNGYPVPGTNRYLNEHTATGIPAVHACVQLIAESVASLPLNLYRRTADGGREIETDHPLQRLLHDAPNQVQTAMEFREQLTASVLLTGNGYARIVFDGAGKVTELVPLHPKAVQVDLLPNGRLRYRHTPNTGGTEVLIQDEVLHVKYRTTDGIAGLSPVTVARNTLSLSLAHQDTESSLYARGARLAGVLTTPGEVEDKDQLRSQWEALYAGSCSAYRTAVLEHGMKFEPMQMSMEDAQFIASRKLNLEEIARIFRVPPPAIGLLDNATYSNVTEQGRWLVTHCLRPWLVRIEQAMNMALLTDPAHFIEHNFEGLLRGSQSERFEAYATARQWGFMSQNEIRRKENLSPIDGGDKYLNPLNMDSAS